jgi:hypothetical protein
MDVDDNEHIEKRSSGFSIFDCPEPSCVLQFRREDRLRTHLLVGSHQYSDPCYSLVDKAALIYRDTFESDCSKQVPLLPVTSVALQQPVTHGKDLKEGWALFSPRKKNIFHTDPAHLLEPKI